MSVYPLGVHGTWGSDAKDHQARSEARHHDSKNWESNQALDIAVPLGTPVYAVEAGKIGDSIGFLPGAKSDSKLEGQRLHLITGKNEYYYAHLSKIAPDIAPGMTVKQGELLGYSGKAGGVEHLHFAVRHGDPKDILKDAKLPDADASKDDKQPSNKDTNVETKEEQKTYQKDAGAHRDGGQPSDGSQPPDGGQSFDANPPMGVPSDREQPSEAKPPDMGVPNDEKQPSEAKPPDMSPPRGDVQQDGGHNIMPPELQQSIQPPEALQSVQPPELQQSIQPPEALQSVQPPELQQSIQPSDGSGYGAGGSDAGGYDGSSSGVGGYDSSSSDASRYDGGSSDASGYDGGYSDAGGYDAGSSETSGASEGGAKGVSSPG